ncbi:MAG: response regulator [Eubacteriales bacterium]|nr:response regulator [Eubacteriales bacterium]
MYTVVVADDEPELRRSLIERTPWEECGFRVAGEAENGAEALDLVEKLEPDLLLTDIRMPFLSGIALARAVREIRPATHIAFLSGYDDFTYAQQAIQYNIISYMLKPISSDELKKELCVIRDKISLRYQEIAQGRTGRLRPHDFLMPLLLGADSPLAGEALERDLHAQAVECGLLKDEDDRPQYVVLATVITDQSGAPVTTRAQVRAVELVLEKYLRASCCFIGSRVVALAAASEAELVKYLHIAVSEIVQSIERVIGAKCTVGVSRETDALSACHTAYREAVGALAYTAAQGADETRFIADLETGRTIRSDYSDTAVQLESVIKGGSRRQVEEYLHGLFDRLRTDPRSSLETDLMMVQLLGAICRSAGAVVNPETADELWRASPLASLSFSYRSLDELRGRMTDFCLRVHEAISLQCRESGEMLCDQALGMVRTQYGDESLSLASISEALHISPNYLSALIRKNTGDTFINLLTAQRLDSAKELLQCTSLKVMEIASKCGYSDQHYFSYCFKKRFGVSPLALRRQQSAEDGA